MNKLSQSELPSVWVTGARGFIGSYLVPALKECGNEVLCLTHSPSTHADYVHVDYSSSDSIERAVEIYGVPESLIHLGWSNVYEINHPSHLTSNLTNSKLLLDTLYELGLKRFISVGSVSEYTDQCGLLQESYMPSSCPNDYVTSKLNFCEYGLKKAELLNRAFMHLRLFYTYGTGQSHNSLIKQLYKASVSNMPISLSPCTQYRDYIYVSDAVKALTLLLKVDYKGIINVGSGEVIQLKEFVLTFWRELGGPLGNLLFGGHEQPSYEQPQPKAWADMSLIESITGWRPTVSLTEGVKRMAYQLRER